MNYYEYTLILFNIVYIFNHQYKLINININHLTWKSLLYQIRKEE